MFNHQAPSYSQNGISGVRRAGMIHKAGFGVADKKNDSPIPASDVQKAMEGVIVFSGGTLTLLALVGLAMYHSDKKFL